jgi:predicted  nucleic acid-binding Zn-ribbon protein
MAKWSEFMDKDSSLRYIEQLNRNIQNHVSDLASVWYDASRYYLACRKLEELTALQAEVKGQIQVLEDDLAEAKKELEKSTKTRTDSNFIRTSNNQIRLMQHVETEIASTISYLSAIPSYAAPDWFVEFLKTVLFDPDSVEIEPTVDSQPVINHFTAPWKKKK